MTEKMEKEVEAILKKKRPPWKEFSQNIILEEIVEYMEQYWDKYGLT